MIGFIGFLLDGNLFIDRGLIMFSSYYILKVYYVLGNGLIFI